MEVCDLFLDDCFCEGRVCTSMLGTEPSMERPKPIDLLPIATEKKGENKQEQICLLVIDSL